MSKPLSSETDIPEEDRRCLHCKLLRTLIGCCIEDRGLSDWVALVIELNSMRVLLTLLHKVQELVDNEDPLG